MKVIYRHVDILNSNDRLACVLHQRPPFRAKWFENETCIAYASDTQLLDNDVLVIPEICGPRLADMAPGIRKVIFNQNAYYTFNNYGLPGDDWVTSYMHPEIIGTMVVSEDSRAYLQYAFPGHKIWRVCISVDPDLFKPLPKEKIIAFMPRKHFGDAVQVFNILKARRKLDGWRILPIDGMNEKQVVEALGRARIFLSFGYPEGFPLPPLEAMLSGCIVTGYHGGGGREYFGDMGVGIDANDIRHFAVSAEWALDMASGKGGCNPDDWGEMCRQIAINRYPPKGEVADVLAVWKDLLP